MLTLQDGLFDRTSKASAKYKQESMIEVVKTADLYLEVDMRMPETKKDNKEIGDLLNKLEELGGIKAPEYMVSTPEDNQATIADPKTGVVLDITIDENNKVIIEQSIVEDVTNLAAPTVNWETDIPKDETAKTVTINITISDEKNGIAKIKFQDKEEEILGNVNGPITRTYKVTKNGNYKFTAEGGNGRKITKTIRIENVYIPETLEIEKAANIGDFVNYSVEVDGVIYDKWRILHKDTNGHVEIVCYNGPDFTLGEHSYSTGTDGTKSKLDYANAVKLLNEASGEYAKGTYGDTARHLGTNPINPIGILGYEEIPNLEEYVKYYNGRESVPEEALKWIEQTHYETDTNAISQFDTSITIDNKKLYGEYSWLGSRFVHFDSNSSNPYVCFCVRSVSALGDSSNKDVGSNTLWGTYPRNLFFVAEHSYALAPVVSLKSGIKIEKGVGNGSEEKPWELY